MPEKPGEETKNRANEAFQGLEGEVTENKEREKTPEEQQGIVDQTFEGIVNSAKEIMSAIPERAKEEGPRKVMEVAKRLTLESLKQEGIILSPKQLEAVNALVEEVVRGQETPEKTPAGTITEDPQNTPEETEKKAGEPIIREESPNAKETLKKTYITADGQLTPQGEKNLAIMNLEDKSVRNRALARTRATQFRAILGLPTSFETKITAQDIKNALET